MFFWMFASIINFDRQITPWSLAMKQFNIFFFYQEQKSLGMYWNEGQLIIEEQIYLKF